MLAVEKAKRLAREGFRTLLICFHRPLGKHLIQATQGIDNLDACSFDQFCQAMAQKVNVPLTESADSGFQGGLDEVYPEALLQEVLIDPSLGYDAILVDEGQDFQETWWVALQECLREGKDSLFYIFYDDNQRVYADRGQFPAGLAPFLLTENVRNTRAIHKMLVSYYRGGTESRPRGPTGRAVERYTYASIWEMTQKLAGALHRLVVAERLRTSEIVVLTPRTLDNSALSGLPLESGLRLVDRPATGPREVQCSSIPEFKGLERPVVIVAELDQSVLRDPQLVSFCYVAFSRPRSLLILIGEVNVLPHLLPPSREQGK